MKTLLEKKITPDWEKFIDCINRKGTPERVHNIELFLDGEIQNAVCEKFNLLDGFNGDDPYFNEKKQVQIQRFLGYDYVRMGLENMDFVLSFSTTEDTAKRGHNGGRSFIDESKVPHVQWNGTKKISRMICVSSAQADSLTRRSI